MAVDTNNKGKRRWSEIMDDVNYTIGSVLAFVAVIAVALELITPTTFAIVLAASFRIYKMRFKMPTKRTRKP